MLPGYALPESNPSKKTQIRVKLFADIDKENITTC